MVLVVELEWFYVGFSVVLWCSVQLWGDCVVLSGFITISAEGAIICSE